MRIAVGLANAVTALCALLYDHHREHQLNDDQAQILRRAFAVWLQTVILSSRKFTQNGAIQRSAQDDTNNNTASSQKQHHQIKQVVAELLEVKDMLSQRLELLIDEKVQTLTKQFEQEILTYKQKTAESEQEILTYKQKTAESLQKQREFICDFCEFLSIDLTESRKHYIDTCTEDELQNLRQSIKAKRAWPDELDQ